MAVAEGESPDSPILRTRGLGLKFGGATIVEDVSLEMREGEFMALIGPNGAGKTSLFNLFSGLYEPSRGSIEFAGRDVTRDPPYARARAGMGRTFQTSSVFPGLTVLENVRLAAQAGGSGGLKIWRRANAERGTLQKARRSLEVVGLSERESSEAGSLSHGDKRKLELAILLCGDARLVLLDEPTAGVSVGDVPEMMRVIRAIHREEEKSVLMVEHRMDVILDLSDRMAVMHQGALLACDTPEKVMENETVQNAYLGESL
ncbi:MAG: ABC transporter ATP-binding protein [Rubrobacteraceae bacterium]